MKLLIIEDDPGIGSAIRSGLEQAGYFAEICRDGERALRLASSTHFSALILDLMLPGMDGLSVCRNLRRSKNHVPILMLTAKDTTRDKVAGLECGADDYLCKPFEFRELLARVRALVRRDKAMKLPRLVIDDLEVDTLSRSVWRAGSPVILTPREYTLLEALASYEGQPLSREAIIEKVWLTDGVLPNAVDVYVKVLRKKVDSDPANRLIHTVYGVGYVLRKSEPDPNG